jgi:predicted nucleotidyltransferase
LVRGACATALAVFAATDHAIRNKLLAILRSDAKLAFRTGAALGLEEAARTDAETANTLLRLANSRSEDEKLRCTCAWALEATLRQDGTPVNAFDAWLNDATHPRLQSVAAQMLARAMANEKLPWDHHTVEKIEHVLMNLDEPVVDALDALKSLAIAREVRHGWRLESILRENLAPISDGIELAFVFGSTARKRQSEDSDIDLMIIGTVTLKELSTPLREAERQLGRRINPAIYSRESFTQRYQSGDPFLLDVYRREKLPVIVPPQTTTTRRGLNDELRAMVAERLAATT